jgi:hypothetical protein
VTARDERTEDIKASLLRWANDFEAGALTDPGLELETGERFAVRVDNVAAVGAMLNPERLEIRHTYGTGSAVVTDRRVVVVKGEQPQVEWRWGDDLGDGTVARHGQGVLWLPSQARHDEGTRHLLGVVTELVTRRFRKPDPALTAALIPAWLRVRGAQRAARGEFEAWRHEVESDNSAQA